MKSLSRIRNVLLIPAPTSHSHLHSHLLPDSSSSFRFRLISNISKSDFTVDYLVNSCGLSPASALKASKYIELKSRTRPDSVLSLFQTFDIPKPHICKMITTRPEVLLYDPNRTLKPKLQLLSHIGMSGSLLGKFLSYNTTFLVSSLENQITSSINFLKGFVHTDTNLVKVLSRVRWMSNAECEMGPNITLLRHHGVPESNISKFIIQSPRTLFMKPAHFKEVLLELKKMGISHSDRTFLPCLHVLLSLKKPKWDAKLVAFKSFGWLEDEVLSLFKRQPYTMAMSEKNIKLTINFLTKNLNWTRADITKNPTVLMLSLEKRVIPRGYVLQTLLSKDLINKASIGNALIFTENVFVEKFIIKYNREVPELLKLYQSKMGTQDKRLLIGHENE